MEYTAFISYRRSDGTRAANWLRNALQSFRPPRSLRERHGRPIKIFLDTAYERGADDFYERTIRPALLASRHLIVLATPDAAARGGRIEDDWMAREIADFGAGPNARNLIVVRAAGAFDGPLPGNLAESYPNAQIIDLRGATDRNPLNLGRKAFFDNEKLKIAASLLDIPLEEMPLLRREEERKRQSRLGLAAGLAAAIVVMSVGVSVYSIQAQLFGQRSLEQSLTEAEAALVRIARRHWDDKAFLRDRDHAIGAMCEVASRLAVEASRGRDPGARAICDLEYLLPYAEDPDLSEEQRRFAATEFERLGAVARALRADMREEAAGGSADDAPRAGASRLGFAVAVNHAAFLKLAPAEAFAAERSEYLPGLEEALRGAAGAGDTATAAREDAMLWLDLALHRYGERLGEEVAAGFDAGQAGLAELSDIAHAIARLPRPPAPEGGEPPAEEAEGGDLARAFRQLHLIASVIVDQRLEEPDPAAARRALPIAEAALDALPSEEAAPRRLRTDLDRWRIDLAEAQSAGHETGSFGRHDGLHAAMAAAHERRAAFAATEGSGETDVAAAHSRFVRMLGDELHLSLDAVQQRARALAAGGDPAGARALLVECHRRRAELYRFTHPDSEWPRVFLLTTEVELAGFEAASGDRAGAEARRLAQWRKVQARPLDRSQLGAVDAQRYDEAVAALDRGHHGHLNDMRGEATALQEKGEHEGAAVALATLLRDDRAWDLLKAAPEEFDRVYAAEISMQLADSLDRTGRTDAAREARLRAIRELLPLTRGNALSGQELERGRAVWKLATEWCDAAGVQVAALAPIETLEAF